jgi:hypothetical protein
MKDFSEREKELADQAANAAREKAESDSRAKAHAKELEQKIADYTREKHISSTLGAQNDRVVLLRGDQRLVIAVKEVVPGKWQYNIGQHNSPGFSPSDLLANVKNHDLSEDEMMAEVIAWLTAR